MQGLRRRIVDALQRSLFDERAPVSMPAPPPLPEPVPRADPLPRVARPTRIARLGEHTLHYALRRSRRRSIGFVVGAEGLVVSAPKWVSLREIDAAVQEKSHWITAKLAEQRELLARREAARTVWADGALIDYLGAPLVLRLGRAGDGVAFDAGTTPRTLHVGLPVDAAEVRVRDVVQSWLQREARRVFTERSAWFAEKLGVRVTRLSLSSAQTRWGSASANGSVRLHWRLIQHPPATIDYVVAHELAHLREMNHSVRFWDVVRSVLPDYEKARRELRAGERSLRDEA